MGLCLTQKGINKMNNQKVKAIALCRVSSVEQLQNNSLNNQDRKVKELAEKYNAEIIRIWSGSVSSKRGKNVKRKDITEMFSFCKSNKKVKYLFVNEPDRFMRSADEAMWAEVEFRRLGVEVLYSDEELNKGDMNARLQRMLKYFTAEGSNQERMTKSIDGHLTALKEGRYTFQPPIGYCRGDVAGIHKIDPITGPYLKYALISIAEGMLTIKSAMKWYNENCPPIASGKHCKMKMDKWRKFIVNPYYAGIVEMNKQVKYRNENGLHEPMITKSQHLSILEVVKHKNKLHKGPIKGGNPRFPMNRILLCEECQKSGKAIYKFTGYDNHNGKNKERHYSRYYCRGCYRTIPRDVIHQQVKDIFSRIELTTNGRKKVIKAINDIWSKEERGLKIQQELYKRDLKALEEKKQQLLDNLMEASSPSLKEDFNTYLEKTRNEIEILSGKLEGIEKNLTKGRSDFLEFALEFIDNMGEHFFELPLEEVGVCKNILFPSGFWVDKNKKVYTPEISLIYRERTLKMDAETSENAPLVGDEGLEPPTFSV